MSRRDRQRVELERLCEGGALQRAVDLAFAHFADYGPDETLVDVLARALDRATTTPAQQRRFNELCETRPANDGRRGDEMEQHRYDVVIVGGGAAGLSAALVLGRARRRVAVIDAGEPRNAPAAHMQGFLSRDGMPPAGFLEVGRAEVRAYGVKIVNDHVTAIEPGFTVHAATGPVLTARRILIAIGASDTLPDVEGAAARWGRDLLHCPYCHGWEVRDKALGVLGTHPDAVEHALLVRQWSDDVVYFAHTQPLTGTERVELRARGIRVVEGEVTRLVIADDLLAGVELADGHAEPRDAVFMRSTNAPHPQGFLSPLSLERDRDGFLVVDPTGRTSATGVWAAGNVVDPRLQVITAAGAGSAAAIAINADLVQEDLALTLRRPEIGVASLPA